MTNEHKLGCGHLVILLSGEFKDGLLKVLEESINKTTFNESNKVKISKDFKLAAILDCFTVNNCQHQVYINGRFYCYNQIELKKLS